MRQQRFWTAARTVAACGALSLLACGAPYDGGATRALESAQVPARSEARWTLTLLDGLGEYRTDAWEMSPNGLVAGTVGLDERPVLWRKDGTATELASFGGSGRAVDVNPRGEGVGLVETALHSRVFRAVVWQDGGMTDLGVPEPFAVSRAIAITPSGTIIGEAAMGSDRFSSRVTAALLWKKGKRVSLPCLVEGGISTTADINADGAVVGTCEGEDGYMHAVRWVHGAVEDLGAYELPGGTGTVSLTGRAINASGAVLAAVEGRSSMRQIVLVRSGDAWVNVGHLGGGGTKVFGRRAFNDAGQVAGRSLNAAGSSRGFFWDGAALHDVGDLGGGSAAALALDHRGQVVGYATDGAGEMHGFLWHAGVMTDLNAAVALPADTHLTSANLINDDGSILVTLFHTDHGMRAALLRPVE